MTWNALLLTALLALDTFPSFTDTPRVQDLRESIMTNVVPATLWRARTRAEHARHRNTVPGLRGAGTHLAYPSG